MNAAIQENIPLPGQSSEIYNNPPHVGNNQSISKIMLFVIIALLPSSIFSVYLFGIKVIFLFLISVISALTAESIFQYLHKESVTITDGTAIITGMLIVMNMTPDIPLLVPALASAFAVIIVKQLSGGLGFNKFNPALAAKVFILALFPSHMTTEWINKSAIIVNEKLPYKIFETAVHSPVAVINELPSLASGFGVTAAKLHFLFLSDNILKSFFTGNNNGFIGEVSVILLLAGALFLLITKIISWHIPAAFTGTTALILLVYYSVIGFPYPGRAVIFNLLTGGFILGMFFMATDYVTSPVTKKGLLIFGAGCGIITSVLRIWGLSESVCFAVLIMNSTVPLIDKLCRPRMFGTQKKNRIR